MTRNRMDASDTALPSYLYQLFQIEVTLEATCFLGKLKNTCISENAVKLFICF